VIILRFPESANELVSFTASPLLEATHSWHVITDPGHHALHLPWVRQCRSMPADIRRGLHELSFVVRGWIPEFLEAPAGGLYGRFDEQLDRIASLPTGLIAGELAQKLIDTTRWLGPQVLASDHDLGEARAELAARSPDAAVLLDDVLDRPQCYLERIVETLRAYWHAGFEQEWHRLEPLLHDEITEAAHRIARHDVLATMRGLIPSVRIDRAARTVSLDMPHDHDVSVIDRAGITLAPSHYAWPHVRISCDEPWPLQITYPIAPLAPRQWRRPDAEELVEPLRALAAEVRLQMISLIGDAPRSTQELSGLVGLSPATVSRHLKLMLDAGILTSQRSGYYMLYQLVPRRLRELGTALMTLAAPNTLAAP
jgi:DNA-binding transcriptional ArsR family regulator